MNTYKKYYTKITGQSYNLDKAINCLYKHYRESLLIEDINDEINKYILQNTYISSGFRVKPKLSVDNEEDNR